MRVVPPPARLSAKQKAAVIVRLLLTQNLSPGIARLHPQLQADLARTMAQLGPVNRATLAQVVQDFTAELDAMALIAPHGLSAALSLLEPHLSPQARDGLRAVDRVVGAVEEVLDHEGVHRERGLRRRGAVVTPLRG